MASRKAADWNFSTLFLVKDSLAVMLEAAGLCEDALREYTELEAAYLETLEQQGSIAAGVCVLGGRMWGCVFWWGCVCFGGNHVVVCVCWLYTGCIVN